jgi:hypothetical protein
MGNPVWKHSPPCKAHLLLVEIFENGKLNAKTTPEEAFFLSCGVFKIFIGRLFQQFSPVKATEWT